MIKKRSLSAKINCIIIAFIILCASFFPTLRYARADVEYPFDSTGALEDLLTLDNFNLEDYPEDKFGLYKKPEVITMMEFAYSPLSANTGYAIYIYFYNPGLLDINVESPLDSIQLAIEYDTNPVTRLSNPTNYQKFGLEYCDGYMPEEYAGRFLKFRVLDSEDENGKILRERVNPEIRRYDISGVTLYTKTGDVKEYNTQRTTYWTGYAAGMNGNSESTLKSDFSWLETIELDVKHTFWRGTTTVYGPNYQNQVDSVYFSVPNYYLTKYGKLQRIKASWYEYYTKDIVVTSNDACYTDLTNYIGKTIVDDNGNYYSNFGLADQIWDNVTSVPSAARWTYGLANEKVTTQNKTNKLYYLFKTEDIKAYDPYTDLTSVGGISANRLYEYIKAYNSSYVLGSVPTRYGNVSADLFESDIPNSRKVENEFGKIQYGYSYYDFDVDADLFDITSYKPAENSFINNTKMYGFWDTLFGNFTTDDDYKNVSPILELEEEFFASDSASSELLIRNEDVQTVKNYVVDAKESDKTTFLFRFATSAYYCAPLSIYNQTSWIPNFNWSEAQAYRAKQSVFLDFDIIQLTFSDEGKLTVVPVVSDPIDIVNPVNPPKDLGNDTLNQILQAIGAWGTLILLIVVALVLLYVAGKLLELFKSIPNKIISGILVILLIVGLILAFYYGISWGIDVITDLGGLW